MKDLSELIGQRYGDLIITEAYRNEKGYIKCKCKCDCGNNKEVYLFNLKSGKTKSCGHRMIEVNNRYADILGKRYKDLTVVKKTEKRLHGQIVWKCKCDCGEYTYATKKQLDRGYVKCCTNDREKEIIGKTFGELLVLRFDEERKKFECKCSCGELVYVTKGNLISGHTKSCGHLQKIHNQKRIDGAVICLIKKKKQSNNSSGYRGVCQTKNGHWQAYISLNKKRYYLGTYVNKNDAIEARKKAENELFGPLLEKFNKVDGKSETVNI